MLDLLERERLGKPEGGRGAGEPLLNALGDGEAGQGCAADTLDLWRRRFAWVPANESAEEPRLVLDPLDVLRGIARAQDFDAGDKAPGVERDEHVVGAGVTDDRICGEVVSRQPMVSPRASVTKCNPRSASRS